MKHRFLALLFALLPVTAHAEKADSEQDIHVSSDRVDVDDVKQISTYSGNVMLTQGTLVMKGAKLVDVTSPDGYHFSTLYAATDGLATMRQKRDGGPDLWMEGEAADRIVYDQKIAIAKFFTKARIRRLTGIKPTDEATGAFLSYNSQTEVVTGANTESGESKPGAGRVEVTIQPHNHPDPHSDAKDNK